MAFVLKQSDTYSWPVKIAVPVDGGRFEDATFDVLFKRLGQDRIEAMTNEARDGKRTDRATCREIVDGWHGVSDGAGDVPFSASAFDQLLDIPGASVAIINAWGESLTGAPAKN